jgi:hypothetical protein
MFYAAAIEAKSFIISQDLLFRTSEDLLLKNSEDLLIKTAVPLLKIQLCLSVKVGVKCK